MKVSLLTLLFVSTLRLGAADRPNIIVFYTDDHGYADLSAQGIMPDVKTPNVDALVKSGVRMVHGYSTAPQCVPSRGGLMTGRFQSRFGLEGNGSSLDGFNQETTIAQRLQSAGYVTAQFGKWHLGDTAEITRHGFKHVFAQNSGGTFNANITVDGKDVPMGSRRPELYHIEGCSRAAAALVERYKDQPFFLYVAFRAPHVPLDAPQKYLDRFPGKMPQRRRQALAMLSAVDDGVGLITTTLKKHHLTEKTLIFFVGDNGAPLKITKADKPGGGAGWDGSLNDPLNGEKGMLSEGGMHVPFVVSWPGTIPGGQVYPHPVSTLDVAATATALAAITVPRGALDGVNLIPFLSGANPAPPHDVLCWRWAAQAAIREGDWKLLRGGDREYLYNLKNDLEEKHNVAAQDPELAQRLRERLRAWTMELQPTGLAVGKMAPTWMDYYDFYLEGKPVKPRRDADEEDDEKPAAAARRAKQPDFQGWQVRNGELSVKDGSLLVSTAKGRDARPSFLTHAQLELAGPLTATVTFKTVTDGKFNLSWRRQGDKEFSPTNAVSFAAAASSEWQTTEISVPVQGTLIHLRLNLPGGTTVIREIQFKTAGGKVVSLWK